MVAFLAAPITPDSRFGVKTHILLRARSKQAIEPLYPLDKGHRNHQHHADSRKGYVDLTCTVRYLG